MTFFKMAGKILLNIVEFLLWVKLDCMAELPHTFADFRKLF